jgi:uncharacterized lipoprotein YbaY
MSKGQLLVSGRILFGKELTAFTDATVYVCLENVSRADAASLAAAKQVLPGVSHQAGKDETLNFSLYGDGIDEGSDYAIRVHVDVDGDGQISPGDYVSPESHPVLTFGRPRSVDVRVTEL